VPVSHQKDLDMMQTETALESHLKRAGYVPREVRFQVAIAEFLNNGGTLDRAHELIAIAADKMESEGRTDGANTAKTMLPPLRSNDAKGQVRVAAKAVCAVPEASTKRDAEGRMDIAAMANDTVPSRVSPSEAGKVLRQQVGHARRGAAAISSVQIVLKKSLFDSIVLPDGRALREIRWSECQGLATRYRKLSRILMAVHNVGVPADADTTLDNLVSEDGLKEIVDAVERFNDIH